MLLYGHYLYGIISVFMYAWQDFGAEFIVRSYRFFFLGHAYMAFVYKQRLGVRGEIVNFEPVWIRRVVDLGGKNARCAVLYHALCVCRYAFSASARPVHKHFVQVAVFKSIFR